jgi:hypothetical protein
MNEQITAEIKVTKPPTTTGHKLKEGLPPLSARIKRLPIDRRGFPVPWFVEWLNGEPDFRVMSAERHVRAVKEKLCWVCGDKLGANLAFPVEPMCGINRISAEPPSHRECAEFAAKACPFLTMPKMVRNEYKLAEGFDQHNNMITPQNPGGIMIARNPGVTLLWFCRDYKIVPTPPSFLCRMGEPFEVAWYAHGRAATRAEVEHSILTGLPFLLDACAQEDTPERQAGAREALHAQVLAFQKFLPAG